MKNLRNKLWIKILAGVLLVALVGGVAFIVINSVNRDLTDPTGAEYRDEMTDEHTTDESDADAESLGSDPFSKNESIVRTEDITKTEIVTESTAEVTLTAPQTTDVIETTSAKTDKTTEATTAKPTDSTTVAPTTQPTTETTTTAAPTEPPTTQPTTEETTTQAPANVAYRIDGRTLYLDESITNEYQFIDNQCPYKRKDTDQYDVVYISASTFKDGWNVHFFGASDVLTVYMPNVNSENATFYNSNTHQMENLKTGDAAFFAGLPGDSDDEKLTYYLEDLTLTVYRDPCVRYKLEWK